ncbi:Bifunctional homocysteine S-methyltransferase/5,10-methylenetetrahydrofolate reductase [subsurface metagenome]
MSKLSDKLKSNEFAVTSEIGPPKGVNIKEAMEDAQIFKDMVVAVNVTDNQSAVMRIGSMAVCHLLKQNGIEPVFQMVTRDRNQIALQSDLLSAWVLGIENVLCLTGDHNHLGDHPESKAVYDIDSVQLLKAVTGLNEGHDMVGNELDGAPHFFQGAVVTPEYDPVELQIIKMKKKIDAGAKFFQTQAVYDIKTFENFMNKIEGIKVPVMAGIVVLKSAGMAKYMNENVAGVFVPDDIIKEMAATPKEDRKKKAIEISARIIRELKPICQGIHIMPLGWDDTVPEIIKQADLT